MAETTIRSGLTPTQWDSEYFVEYVRKQRFMPYMGTSMTNVIVTKEDLSRKPGDGIVFGAVRSLTGGVTGNAVLEGNEAEMDTRSMPVKVKPIRNAVILTEWDEQRNAFDLREAARDGLQTWSMEKMREDVIYALKSVPNASNNMVAYELATAAERNAYLVDNTDRIQFGKLRSNSVSGVWATSLATLDNTDDKLTPELVSLAKRMAQEASPRITPFRTKAGDQEWYVMFCNPRSFRDIQTNATMMQANRDARVRGVDSNPIFTGGELVWDGVILKEIPELGPAVAATATRMAQTGGIVSNGTIDCGFNFLCGSGALGAAWARRLKSTTDVRDYGFRHGVGVSEIRGIEKLMFGKGTDTDISDLVQAGVVTVMTAAVADA